MDTPERSELASDLIRRCRRCAAEQLGRESQEADVDDVSQAAFLSVLPQLRTGGYTDSKAIWRLIRLATRSAYSDYLRSRDPITVPRSVTSQRVRVTDADQHSAAAKSWPCAPSHDEAPSIRLRYHSIDRVDVTPVSSPEPETEEERLEQLKEYLRLIDEPDRLLAFCLSTGVSKSAAAEASGLSKREARRRQTSIRHAILPLASRRFRSTRDLVSANSADSLPVSSEVGN